MTEALHTGKGAGMPNEGPNGAFVVQYETMYDLLYQQTMRRLREYVRVKEGVVGTMTAFGIMGGTDMQDISGERHGTSSWQDTPMYRRWAVKQDFINQQILDQEDMMEVAVDLEMGYVQNSIAAINRRADKMLVDAATATAVSGATGTSTSAYLTTAPATDGSGGNQIAVGGTGCTLDKMRLARAIFDAREVGLDEMNMGISNFVWVTNAKGHQDLMSQTETTSTDYIGVVVVNGQEERRKMPLVGGRIPFMMGFKIVIINQLNLSGSDFINLAWHQKAMGFAVWGGRFLAIDRLPEHRYSTGVTLKEHFGAVRIQDAGVLSIVCSAT